ncbi:FUSC family protein [Nocardiopsis umidischolae]|uniref:FUSC family protein n=3 Tax=Streptosporangiales TaxID=85012 RepID=A0ABY6YTU6_9ACTN|nr:FUSC family protein [Streptomonospora nanhaiensis]WAE75685.1 FUSC family protein [Streptomonospora nanhaiensis]
MEAVRDLGTTGDTGPMNLGGSHASDDGPGADADKGPRRAQVGERPRPRVDLKAVFGLEAGAWAWTTAAQATIAMTVSFALAALVFGPQIGTLAALGSMTVLYEKKTPYAYRSAALALVGLGFVAAVAVNSMAASLSPWAAVASIGLTAGVATWVCAAWRVDKPGPMFFVLVATISTIAPGTLADVPLHALVAALGAAVGWAVSMSGAPLRARHPEYQAVAAAFRALGSLLRSVGTPDLDHAQHKASTTLADAWRIVLLGQTRGYRTTAEAARLRALLRWVSDIHLAATQVCMARPSPLPEEVAEYADALALAVADPGRAPDPDSLDELRRGMRPRSLEARLYSLLSRAAHSARRASQDEEDDERTETLHDERYPALWGALRSSLSGDSLIRPTALRMWVTVTAAGVFGLWLGLDHYYWVALTTTAVLQAGNVVLTMNRSVQRSLGTLLGVVVGAGLLMLDLPLAAVIVLAGVLQGATQLVVGRNFLYASVLLTPMALLLSYTASPHPITALAESRIIDTVVGSAFGMAGSLLLWRKASATRLPQAIAGVLATTRQCMLAVLDQEVEIGPGRRYRLRRDMRAALVSLRGVYESAIGDVPRAASTRPLWPVVVATQRIGYLALAALAQDRKPEPVGVITLQRVDLAFGELISAIEERRTPRLGALPRLAAYPRINMELRALSNSMTSAVAQDERAAQQEVERRAQRERNRAQKDVDADL